MFALSFRAEPLRKKKKVDPKKDQAAKDRLKKRIRRLEKASQELIPIEDFITPVKFLNKERWGPLCLKSSEQRTSVCTSNPWWEGVGLGQTWPWSESSSPGLSVGLEKAFLGAAPGWLNVGRETQGDC